MTGSVAPQQVALPISAPRITAGPDPDRIDTLGASARVAFDELPQTQRQRLIEAYGPVVKALRERNGKGYFAYQNPWSLVNPWADDYATDDIWRDIETARKADPKAFAELGDRKTFEERALARDGNRARDQRTLARSEHGVTAFAGGVATNLLDPVNIATIPISGGASSVARAILTEAVINAGVEVAQQPALAGRLKRMGEELTLAEAGTNVLAAAAFGGIVGGAGKYIGDRWAKFRELKMDEQEAAWAAILDADDELAAQLGREVDWDALDDHLPELTEALIGRDSLSEEELAAAAILRRERHVDALNPARMAGGDRAYGDGLAAAMARILDANPAPPRNAVPGARTTPASLGRSTAISSGTVAGDARSVVKARIAQVESGGSNSARNPRSSATGKYQFIGSTWLSLYKSRYGSGGLSDAAILAKRSNPHIQDVLMNDLMAANERALARGGVEINAGNLYLAHFAGSDGALRLHRADPSASARSVLGDAVVRANRFLEGMSAGDVIAWANRKMGGRGDAMPSRAGRAEDFDSELAEIDRQLAELDEEFSPVEPARADELIGDVEETSLPEMPDAGIEPARAPEIEPDALPDAVPDGAPAPRAENSRPTDPAVVASRLTPEQSALLPQLKEAIADRSQSLKLDRLAKRLDATESDVQEALGYLVERGQGVFQTRGKGAEPRIQRLPARGPEDALTFIARSGGVSFDGLNAASRAAGFKGHGLRDRRNLQRTVPGAGSLLREKGLSVDEIGELLWDAGYFGSPSAVPRPDENAVLEFLEMVATSKEKHWIPGDEPETPPLDYEEIYEADGHFREVVNRADELELELSDDELYRLAQLYDGDILDALTRLFNEEAEFARLDAFFEGDREAAEWYMRMQEDALDEVAGPDREFAPDFAEQGADPRDAGSGVSRAPDRPESAAGEGPLDEEGLAAFDDPRAGPGAEAQSRSLEHDAQAAITETETGQTDFAAPSQDQRRTALERQGDGRMRSDKAQKPVGSDGGLFDTQALNEMEFRFDEEGGTQDLRSALDDLAAEEAEIGNIRDCMK